MCDSICKHHYESTVFNMLHAPVCDGDVCKECVFTQDPRLWFTGVVQSAAVKLQSDDGEHEDCKKEQQADLQQRNHGLHDGLQDYLQTWKESTE